MAELDQDGKERLEEYDESLIDCFMLRHTEPSRWKWWIIGGISFLLVVYVLLNLLAMGFSPSYGPRGHRSVWGVYASLTVQIGVVMVFAYVLYVFMLYFRKFQYTWLLQIFVAPIPAMLSAATLGYALNIVWTVLVECNSLFNC